jgi:hypothetical protein
MKQTAVEWLVQQLSKEWQLEDRDLHLIEQAKEMELSQLVECWNTAHQAGRFEGKGIAEKYQQQKNMQIVYIKNILYQKKFMN